MDQVFAELVAVNKARAINFFFAGLREVIEGKRVDQDEMIYVASVLAHFSQTSRFDTTCMPCLSSLGEVFDGFVLSEFCLDDPEILEIAGSQTLLFAGFFRDQMRRRHNVRWYDTIGQSFYDRASRLSKIRKKQKLFEGLAESFPRWTIRCNYLSRNLYVNRFLLKKD